jgi:uncharacterized protein YggU (UPF0235/DUF167 family)
MSYKLAVRVITRSSKEKIEYLEEQKLLKIWTHEAPVEGKANDKVIEIIAAYLKLNKKVVQIISGATGKNKIVGIDAKITEKDFIEKPRLFD